MRQRLESAALGGRAREVEAICREAGKEKIREIGQHAAALAAGEGHAGCLRALFEGGADPNAGDKNGWNAGHVLAGASGEIGESDLRECVSALRDFGWDQQRRGGVGALTALLLAAKAGGEILVGELLRAGADPNMANLFGYAPLHAAAERGAEGCLRLLLEAGADPSARNSDGMRPADVAAEHGEIGCAELLERAEAAREESASLATGIPERAGARGKAARKL